MKKWKLILTLTLAVTIGFTACGKQGDDDGEDKVLTVEEAEKLIHEGNQFDVTFDGYEEAGGRVALTYEDGTEETFGGAGYIGAEGLKVRDVLAVNEIKKLEAVHEDDTFEGWMEYKIVLHDEEDWTSEEYVKVSDDLYTMDEVLNRKIEDYSLMYVAKWAGMPAEEYFADEVVDMGDMSNVDVEPSFTLFANGGMMTFDAEEPYESDMYTYYWTTGKSLDDAMHSEWDDPLGKIEKDGEEFTGWTVYVGDTVEWPDAMTDVDEAQCFEISEFWYIQVNNCKVYGENVSTEDLLKIVSKGDCYYAVANWE